MGIISNTQFLRMADRLAAQYEVLLDAQIAGSLPENAAFLQVGIPIKASLVLDVDSNATLDTAIIAKTTGVWGNSVVIKLINPSAASQSLIPQVFGNNINIYLATNSGGAITTTWVEVFTLLTTFPAIVALIDVVRYRTFTGTAAARTWTLAGGLGGGVFTIYARDLGEDGNDLTLTLVDPGGASKALSLAVTGNDLVVNLATNSSSVLTTTATLLKAAIEANYQTDQLYQIVLFENGDLALSVLAITNFSGAKNGPYASLVLEEVSGTDHADPDVARMIQAAQDADDGFTARAMVKGGGTLENLLAALNSHLSRTGATSLQKYLTDSAIRVHENFSIVEGNRSGTNLNAVNVFKKVPVQVARFDLSGAPLNAILTPGIVLGQGSGIHSSTNYAAQQMQLVLSPAAVAAYLLVDPTGTNNALTWTAKHPGRDGNKLTITYTDPGTPSQSLSASVANTWDITINLATNSSSVITTTSALIKALALSNAAVAALVTAVSPVGDTGVGVVTARSTTNLANGLGLRLEAALSMTLTLKDSTGANKLVSDLLWDVNVWPEATQMVARRGSFTTVLVTAVNDQIRYLAKNSGVSGNSITLTYVNPGTASQPLGISVTGSDITVNLATNSSSVVNSTATQIKSAIESNSAANALVYATLLGNGSGTAAAFTETSLAGGEDPDRYFEVINATVDTGGTVGDIVLVQQIVEREITV